MKSGMRGVLSCSLLALAFWAPALSAQDIAPPEHYVEDRADVIDEQHEHALNGYLQELEQKTTCQIIVLTVETTGAIPIEQYALGLAEKWKLGQKGKDNGALIAVAVRDRKYRFEVGYGLEGPLPDSFVGTVGRQHFVPSFRAGAYGKGLFDGTVAIINRVAAEYDVEITGIPDIVASRENRPQVIGFLFSVLGLVFLIVMFRLFGFWGLLFFPGMRRYPGGAWGGGSSFSRGSFGGFGSFGGGGGGSFGGGGASGSW